MSTKPLSTTQSFFSWVRRQKSKCYKNTKCNLKVSLFTVHLVYLKMAPIPITFTAFVTLVWLISIMITSQVIQYLRLKPPGLQTLVDLAMIDVFCISLINLFNYYIISLIYIWSIELNYLAIAYAYVTHGLSLMLLCGSLINILLRSVLIFREACNSVSLFFYLSFLKSIPQ